MKWAGTLLYLIGMVFTAANVFPLNLVFGGAGGVLWALVGFKQQDKALIVVELASAGIYATGLLFWLEAEFHILAALLR